MANESEVQGHGVSVNTNEDGIEDDPGAREKLSANTNEDAADDEVESHGHNLNTNEDAAEDD